MMNIPPENTFVLKDVSFSDLDEIIDWLTNRIAVITRVLGSKTGILGMEHYLGGLDWKVLRPYAMKLVAPFDFVQIDLN